LRVCARTDVVRGRTGVHLERVRTALAARAVVLVNNQEADLDEIVENPRDLLAGGRPVITDQASETFAVERDIAVGVPDAVRQQHLRGDFDLVRGVHRVSARRGGRSAPDARGDPERDVDPVRGLCVSRDDADLLVWLGALELVQLSVLPSVGPGSHPHRYSLSRVVCYSEVPRVVVIARPPLR